MCRGSTWSIRGKQVLPALFNINKSQKWKPVDWTMVYESLAPSCQITIITPMRPPIGCDVHWHSWRPLTLSVLEVVAPQRSDFVLTADVPHCEADILVFYSFHIKTWTGENKKKSVSHKSEQFKSMLSVYKRNVTNQMWLNVILK